MASPKRREARWRAVRGAAFAWTVWSVCISGWLATPAYAEFNSTSTGADGALAFNCPTPQTIEWDPAGLDPDQDNVFEFTTVTIPTDCTIKLTARKLGQAPVVWLATGDVLIDGTLDLSGAKGHGSDLGSVRSPAIPGPGGFAGGPGASLGQATAQPGYGPGAGGIDGEWGAAAGHVVAGEARYTLQGGGPAYGSSFLIPLLGGSGGGGSPAAGGGGAGGGAILIASSASIRVNGAILANGGNGGGHSGGGGSGGSIRLVASELTGSGSLSAWNGSGANGTNNASRGRIRLESETLGFTGNAYAAESRAVVVSPSTVIRNQIAVSIPSLRVMSVGGVPVPSKPSGGFSPADVAINTPDPVTVEIQGEHVPVGTVVTLEVHHDTLGTSTVESTPLAGTEAESNATATAAIDPGFSLVTLRADWNP